MGRLTPRVRAVTAVLLGGLITAVGAALVYLPAGLLLGGAELVVFGLLMVDVDQRRK